MPPKEEFTTLLESASLFEGNPKDLFSCSLPLGGGVSLEYRLSADGSNARYVGYTVETGCEANVPHNIERRASMHLGNAQCFLLERVYSDGLTNEHFLFGQPRVKHDEWARKMLEARGGDPND